jgi:hypothetical protein
MLEKFKIGVLYGDPLRNIQGDNKDIGCSRKRIFRARDLEDNRPSEGNTTSNLEIYRSEITTCNSGQLC